MIRVEGRMDFEEPSGQVGRIPISVRQIIATVRNPRGYPSFENRFLIKEF